MRRAIVLMFFFLGLAANAHAQGRPADDAALQVGDALRVQVWEHPELSGQFDILSDGTVAHPVFRNLRVINISRDSVNRLIGSAVGRFDTTPQFVVQPLYRVLVGGQVRQPNLYLLPAETTLSQAVGLAGGVSEQANLEEILLIRGGQQVVFDLSAPAGPAIDPIRSGDQIVVDRRRNFFRDYIAPSASVTAALVSLLGLLLR